MRKQNSKNDYISLYGNFIPWICTHMGRNKQNTKTLSLVFILIAIAFQPKAQKQYTISVPTTRYSHIAQPSATDALDIGHIIDEVAKYAKIYQHNQCMETLDPEIERHLKDEMKKISEGTPYSLTVDYESCKFISLLPSKGSGEISSSTSTVYHITVNQEIVREPTIKKDEDSEKKAALLATYQDTDGKWIAMGPYLSSDGFETENHALASLFYSDNDLRFLCQRGKFKIYALTAKLEKYSNDIRSALKMLGITDIPE